MVIVQGSGKRRMGTVVLALALLGSPRLWIEENLWSLATQRDRWAELVFLDGLEGKIPSGQAATFNFGNDPGLGGFVSVGPWRAGSWGARLEYRDAYPSPTGTIRGHYRTEGLLPYQASVNIAYTQGSTVLAKRKYHLAPSTAWRPFEVAVRHPPAGADSFRAAFGLSDRTEGRVDFAKLTIGKGVSDLAFPVLPAAVTRPSPTGPFATGATFRLDREGDTLWLVTPAGRPFYSVATVGPSGRATDLPSRPGSEWAAYLRDLGFNSLAGWTRVSYWTDVNSALEAAGGEPLPIFAAVESNSLPASFDRLADALGNTGTSGHAFPDPFDPAFAAAYRAEVIATYAHLGAKSWFAGWFADNELDHADLTRQVYSAHCARAFKDFLVARYATIAELNSAWQTGYASFDALIAARPDPILPIGTMAEDFRRFSRVIVSRYVDLTIGIIRSIDPGRPIFSNRFMASGIGPSASFLDLYARYDGIAVNLYPQNQRAGLSDNEQAYLRLFHEGSGKPVLVSEWSVPATDSGLYDGAPEALDWSWNEAVGTQAERAAQAARLTVDLFNLPFVVGAQWFTWKDYRSSRHANRGLLTADGEPWDELLRQLRAAQQRIGP